MDEVEVRVERAVVEDADEEKEEKCIMTKR